MTPRQRGWLLPPMAVFLAAGILLGRAADSPVYGAAACVLSLASCLLLRGRGRFCALMGFMLALGCLRGYVAFHPSLPSEGYYRVAGIVSEEVELRSGRQVRTALKDVTLDGEPVRGGAYWSFYEDAIPVGLSPGRQVSFTARLYHPSGASNPDGYDFREELLRRGIRIGVYGAEELSVSGPASFSPAGTAAALRHSLTEALRNSALGTEAGGYAAAMLFGNRSFLSRADRSAFSRLGVAHVLSVSGFHVGVLIGFLALFFRLLRLPQNIRLALYALVLGTYVVLCGSAQPVIRASLLFLLGARGRILRRPRSLLHLLSAVLVLMLLWSPVQLTGLSLQLSFGAVYGLALVTPYLSSLLPERSRFPRRIREALCAGLGAQAGILLPELRAFHELPQLGLLLNIPMLGYAALLIGAYWAALLTLPVPGVSAAVCTAARFLTSGLLAAVRFLGDLPGVTLWTGAPGLLSVAGLVLVTAGLCVLFRWRGRTRAALASAGVLLLALSMIPLPHRATEYFQFSAGDSDAAVFWDREEVWVVDAGTEDSAVSSFLHRKRLVPSAVILTHLHSDHAGGLSALREDRIPVSRILIPDGAEDADVHPDMLRLLEEFRAGGTEIIRLSAGDRLDLPSGTADVLWPEEGKTRPGQDANQSCLVLRFSLKGSSMLHTGDLDGRYEMYSAVPSDLLKVAHHGSSGSSSPEYLDSVRPSAVLLSCGSEERYLQFRARLPEEIPLFSTAVSGMLTVRFEEGGFTVETFLPDGAH